MTAPSLLLAVLGHFSTIALCTAGLAAGASQFTSGVDLVEVYATVTDAKGEVVRGLTRDDFEVLEDGVPQRVSAFAAGDFPLTVALAVDRSFSMAGERLAAVTSAARGFLGTLRPEDQTVIIGISSTVEVISALSTDRQAQLAALSAVDAFGTTGLHDAVIRAIELTQPGKGRRVLLLLSDGADRYSRAARGEVLDAARRSDVMIYPVAVGRDRPALFAELAAASGGRSFHTREPKALHDVLTTIATELRHQYLLGYTPARPVANGRREWRSIAVKTHRPGLVVRARDGYR